jgi:hypothetical protein
MDKMHGNDLDDKIYTDLQISFTDFIKSYSILLENVENFYQTKTAERLFDDTDDFNFKYEATSELVDTLSNMVPYFMKIAALENKLIK